MAKKRPKDRDTEPVNAPETTPAASEVEVSPESPASCTAAGQTLMEEVQLFLTQREELAKKLAEEIAATEQKLADLKKTAAQLFPETAASAPKDKKVKKVSKSKPPVREPEPAPDDATASEASPSG